MGLCHKYSALQQQHERGQKICEPSGHCCVSVVNFWNPDTSIEDLLVAIFALFYQANAESAYHGYSEEDINEFIKNKRNYNKKVAYFTEKYANGQYKPPKDLTKWDFTM